MSLLTLLLFAATAAEVPVITLKEAWNRALSQNADILMARIAGQQAQLAIGTARDPFRPKVYVGSGLAYSNGFPMSIEGSAPSIIQSRAVASIFNKPYSFRIAQVTEQARTAALDTEIRQDEALYQVTLHYLDAARWGRAIETAARQIESLERADEVVRIRVREGRELELAAKQSALAVAKARQRHRLLERERDQAEANLAHVLGLGPEDRLRPSPESPRFELPESVESAVALALSQSRELRKLESEVRAKSLEARQHRASRLPSVDLVAQYGLFARFNNYEEFFRKFQRHNGQIGVSLQVPVLTSAAATAQAAQADAEIVRLRTRMNQLRNRISVDTRNAHQDLALLEQGREVAKLDLDVAREQVNVTLARFEEGRASVREMEEARFQEQEKWIAYYDGQFSVERARLDLARLAGGVASLIR